MKKHDIARKKANVVKVGNMHVSKHDMNDPEIRRLLNWAARDIKAKAED